MHLLVSQCLASRPAPWIEPLPILLSHVTELRRQAENRRDFVEYDEKFSFKLKGVVWIVNRSGTLSCYKP